MNLMSYRSPQYKIIAQVNIVIDIEFATEIAASSENNTYPGPQQFLKDVRNILNNLGYNILFCQNSNRIQSNSPSVYFVYEFALSDTESVMCAVYLRVSDHRNINTQFTLSHSDYVNALKAKYCTNDVAMWKELEIIIEVEAQGEYKQSLEDIECELKDAEQSFKMLYRSSKKRNR